MVKSAMKHFYAGPATHIRRRSYHQSQQGFTLLEVLVVALMIGILGGIAAPGWLAYFARREVVTTQDNVFSAIRSTQVRAQQKRQSYQFSIREDADGVVEWASHPINNLTAADVANILWTKADSGRVEINTQTTLPQDDPETIFASDPFYVRFDYRGNIDSTTLGQLTFSSDSTADNGADDVTAKSIVVETLLGAMRKE